MNRPELFVKSVDTLVDAYEKGNLQHLSPCNCAVGNLIAYNTGTYRFNDKTGGTEAEWAHLVNAIRDAVMIEPSSEKISEHWIFSKADKYNRTKDLSAAYNQIYLSGYSASEVEKIESAFEKVIVGECGIGISDRKAERTDEPLDGLLNAIKVLGEIHGIPEETVTCMRDKILNKTYKKSFELVTPADSPIAKVEVEELNLPWGVGSIIPDETN